MRTGRIIVVSWCLVMAGCASVVRNPVPKILGHVQQREALLDNRPKKKPAAMRASGLRWILLELNMVVMGGLEPGCAGKHCLQRSKRWPHPKRVAEKNF